MALRKGFTHVILFSAVSVMSLMPIHIFILIHLSGQHVKPSVKGALPGIETAVDRKVLH